jgi:hypothetical protein
MRQLFHKNFASLLLLSETDSKAYDFIICMYVKWLFADNFQIREGLARPGISNQ